jgi:hypothetical protein
MRLIAAPPAPPTPTTLIAVKACAVSGLTSGIYPPLFNLVKLIIHPKKYFGNRLIDEITFFAF